MFVFVFVFYIHTHTSHTGEWKDDRRHGQGTVVYMSAEGKVAMHTTLCMHACMDCYRAMRMLHGLMHMSTRNRSLSGMKASGMPARCTDLANISTPTAASMKV